MTTALIGNGYWAKILRPYIDSMFNVKYTADSKFDLKQIWKDNTVDSVFIVTPVDTHFEIAKEALSYGKNVFIEKPLTTCLKEADKLKKIADKNRLKIVTDYTYTFSANIQNEINNPIDYIEIVLYRNNPIKYTDANVHWVLSCHALSIVDMLIGIKNTKFYTMQPLVGLVIGDGFKIFTSLISPERVTDIIVADSQYVRTIPVESDNLGRAVKYFYDCLYKMGPSNIDAAIRITEAIERGCKSR